MAEEPEKIEGTVVDDEDPSIKAEAEKQQAEQKEADAKAAEEAAKAKAVEEAKVAEAAKTDEEKKVEEPKRETEIPTPKKKGLNLVKENIDHPEAAANPGNLKPSYSDSKTTKSETAAKTSDKKE